VQFLPSHSVLADEAIERAATLEYEGVPVRVVRPEYLAALYLEPGARTLKRRERAAALRESRSTASAPACRSATRFGWSLSCSASACRSSSISDGSLRGSAPGLSPLKD